MSTEIFTCPNCENKIKINPKLTKEQNIKCQKCGGIFSLSADGNNNNEQLDKSEIQNHINHLKKQNHETSKKYIWNFFPLNLQLYNLISIVIGILFIAIGSCLLFYFLNQILNLGIALIIIGVSFIFFTSEIKKPQKNMVKKIIISEKITIIFTIWIFISILITGLSDFRLFLVAIIIGFLVLKEIASSDITENLDKKMKIFIIIFFLVYLMMVGNTIISFLSE
jgi:hypothetical protein